MRNTVGTILLIFIFIIVLVGSSTASANFIYFEGEEDWQKGERDGLTFSISHPDSLELKREGGTYIEEGVYVSPTIETTHPFNRMVASWNVLTPGESYAVVEARVLVNGIWTDWHVMGMWGENYDSRSISLSEWADDYGIRINIDIFEILQEESQKYQLKATLYREGDNSPVLQGLAGTAYHSDREYPEAEIPEGYLREIDVPERSQMVEDPDIAPRICSPVSLAMMLEKYGDDIPSDVVAEKAHDAGERIYGNWSFNVAYAGALGYRAYVDHYPGINDIKQQIAEGNPVITSISYGEGELDNAPTDSTAGHLVLVRGFEERNGETYVIVNDPAAPDEDTVRRLYQIDQFEDAWVGIVYIIEER